MTQTQAGLGCLHLISKYRSAVLKGTVAERAKEFVREVGEQMKWR